MPMDFEYDVFLSHSSRDKAIVRALAERLKAEGLKVFFDEWSIQVGDHIYLSIEKGLQSSRALLLCLSEAAVKSDWVAIERGAALFRGPNKDRPFVPVLIADCELPDALRAYKYADYRTPTEKAYQQILVACRPAGVDSASAKVEPEPAAVADSRCGQLREKVEVLLAGKVQLRRDLAAQVKEELHIPPDAWPDEELAPLLESICARLKTSQLLRIFLEVSRRPNRGDGLEETLRFLLPVVYWNELDRTKKEKISKDLMRLPIVEAAYAEIVQAAYDGRRLELFCTPEAALRSKLALEAPQLPESGISKDLRYEELVEHLHGELVGRILYRDPLLRKDQFELILQMPPALRTKQLAKIIDKMLDREKQNHNRVYFLLVDKATYVSYGDQANEFLLGFRALLPALRIVVLEGEWEQYADETTSLEDLLQLLLALSKPAAG